MATIAGKPVLEKTAEIFQTAPIAPKDQAKFARIPQDIDSAITKMRIATIPTVPASTQVMEQAHLSVGNYIILSSPPQIHGDTIIQVEALLEKSKPTKGNPTSPFHMIVLEKDLDGSFVTITMNSLKEGTTAKVHLSDSAFDGDSTVIFTPTTKLTHVLTRRTSDYNGRTWSKASIDDFIK